MANENTELAEQPDHKIFLTSGTLPVARLLTRQMKQAGNNVTAMTGTNEGALVIRSDGGLPVYAHADRQGEIRGMLSMAKATVVVHLLPLKAAHSPYLASPVDAEMLVNATRAAVEAAKETEVGYFIHLSHAFLYGDTGGERATEDFRLSPGDAPLRQAAIEAEGIVKASGLRYTILRTGYVYSPDEAYLRQINADIRAGRPVHCGDGTHKANWVTAHDLNQLLKIVIDAQPEDVVFNAVDDEPISAKHFLEELAEQQGIEAQGVLANLLKAVIPAQAGDLLTLNTQASNAKAKEQLGWTLQYPTAKAGLEEVLLQWRAAFTKS
jgi:nucleoside-diphosphate-sugar epimerase